MRVVVVALVALTGCAGGDPGLAMQQRQAAGLGAYRPGGTQSARPITPTRTISVERAQATPAQIARYQRAAADRLRDPQAAQFRGTYVVQHSNGDRGLCGEVNGKNAYGGYIGFEPFYAALVEPAGANMALAVMWSGSTLQPAIADRCRIGGSFAEPVR